MVKIIDEERVLNQEFFRLQYVTHFASLNKGIAPWSGVTLRWKDIFVGIVM